MTLIMYGFIILHHGYILLLYNSMHPNGLLVMKIFHIIGEEIDKNGCSWPSINCIASSPARLLLAVLAHFHLSFLLVTMHPSTCAPTVLWIIFWHGANIYFLYRIYFCDWDIQILSSCSISNLIVEGVIYLQTASELCNL